MYIFRLMTRLDEIPMFKPFIAFLLGIVTGYFWNLSSFLLAALSIAFGLLSLLLFSRKFKRTIWISISGISILLFLLCLGGLDYSVRKSYQPVQDGFYTYHAQVTQVIRQKPDYTRCYLKISEIKGIALTKPYTIVANIYSQDIAPGDEIWASSGIHQLKEPANKGQFDVRKYYGYKYIYQTTSLDSSKYIRKEYTGVFHFRRWCFLTSKRCAGIFSKYIPERSSKTMQALLLGDKDEIEDNQMQIYQQTGVMHVLAVSGMHVGILYVGLLLLLTPGYKRWKWITILPIAFIWVFSFVTGAGPAVLRAALMIMFVDIGKKLDEECNSINLLFASGMILLIVQPYLVWDIGFQLSFAAMLGLFYAMKPIQNMAYFKRNFVRKYIWSPTAMSISAQAATTPLTFYYFGNFPLLFILTNLVILLPVTLALYGGVMLLLSSWLLPQFLLLGLGKGLDFILHYGFNYFLTFAASLPGAFIGNIYISKTQVLLIYGALFLICYWFYHLKNGKWLLGALILICMTIGISTFQKWQQRSQLQINILQVPHRHAIAVNNYLWTSKEYAPTVVRENKFFLDGFLRENGWKAWKYQVPKGVVQDTNLICVGGLSFFILNQNFRNFSNKEPITVDYLILGDQLFLDIAWLRQRFKYQQLVLDGSLPYAKYTLFKRLLQKAQIPYWDTRENGALSISL